MLKIQARSFNNWATTRNRFYDLDETVNWGGYYDIKENEIIVFLDTSRNLYWLVAILTLFHELTHWLTHKIYTSEQARDKDWKFEVWWERIRHKERKFIYKTHELVHTRLYGYKITTRFGPWEIFKENGSIFYSYLDGFR